MLRGCAAGVKKTVLQVTCVPAAAWRVAQSFDQTVTASITPDSVASQLMAQHIYGRDSLI